MRASFLAPRGPGSGFNSLGRHSESECLRPKVCRLVITDARRFNRKSPIENRQFLLPILLFALLVPGCAGRRRPVFVPAAREEADRALTAWRDAVARAEARGPARLLYEARVSQGPFRMSGTLAVLDSGHSVDATLSGPFGDVVARYADGALRGNGIRPVLVAPDELRWLLAGAWKGAEEPVVAGLDGQDALLRWTSRERVEGVLDIAAGRFKSVKVTRSEGGIVATYSGETSSRPQRIELEDVKSGNSMRLSLVGVEPE
jgi:hypothetical protein